MSCGVEPAGYDFAVHYRPGDPLSLADWQAETGALLVVNGGYFTEALVATGLVIVDGQPVGVSYGEFAGDAGGDTGRSRAALAGGAAL